MIIYKVIRDGVQTHSWTSEAFDETHYESSFGKPNRWVRSELDDEEVEFVPDENIEAALESRDAGDDNGDKEYHFAAEYELQIEDIGNEWDWERLRIQRNAKLAECDWTQLSDTPLSSEEKSEWATYRQLLRDIPNSLENPLDVEWPSKP